MTSEWGSIQKHREEYQTMSNVHHNMLELWLVFPPTRICTNCGPKVALWAYGSPAPVCEDNETSGKAFDGMKKCSSILACSSLDILLVKGFAAWERCSGAI